MNKLILLRHAQSDWHTGKSDFDRPLNERGKKAAPLIGQRLADRADPPEQIISSPAKRARQTAKRIASEIGYPSEQIEYREEIYEASRQTLIDLLHEQSDSCDSLMLIGHNPGFSELGEWLTATAPDWLPTCGLLELELPITRWSAATENCAALLRYDYPKKSL